MLGTPTSCNVRESPGSPPMFFQLLPVMKMWSSLDSFTLCSCARRCVHSPQLNRYLKCLYGCLESFNNDVLLFNFFFVYCIKITKQCSIKFHFIIILFLSLKCTYWLDCRWYMIWNVCFSTWWELTVFDQWTDTMCLELLWPQSLSLASTH